MDRIRSFVTSHWAALVGVLAFALLLHVDPTVALTLGSGGLVIGLVNINDDVIKYLIKQSFLDAGGGYKLNIKAKTADYTIVTGTDPSGTIFTNRGAAGAVAFTLPAAAAALAGVFYEFLGAADQSFTVLTPVADTLTVVNDAAADSLAVSTASHKIGAHMRVVCDGTAWFAYGDSVGDTFTVAT